MKILLTDDDLNKLLNTYFGSSCGAFDTAGNFIIDGTMEIIESPSIDLINLSIKINNKVFSNKFKMGTISPNTIWKLPSITNNTQLAGMSSYINCDKYINHNKKQFDQPLTTLCMNKLKNTFNLGTGVKEL